MQTGERPTLIAGAAQAASAELAGSAGVLSKIRGRTPSASRWRGLRAGSLLVALLISLLGCGGGGGGGGGATPASGPNPATVTDVTLEGIFFRNISGELVDAAPFEVPTAVPPTQGAPLNQVVVFVFSGEPQGPFTKQSLPVFTTPGDLDPTLGAPAGLGLIFAKGEYVRVGDTVEFRPFVPSAPLELSLQGQPKAVPGLLPGSVYTARVSTIPGQAIQNLVGPGAEETFGTTSNPAVFFPSGPDSIAPPSVIATSPPEGGALAAHPFNDIDLASGLPLYPNAASEIVLSYDRQLLPTAANLFGEDLDDDNQNEATFFLSTPGTPLLVGHTAPANSFGAHGAFGALSGLSLGQPPAADGSDILLRGGPADLPIGNQDPFFAAPRSLVVGPDPALSFAAFSNPSGNDLFGLVGPVLGDARFAKLGRNASGTQPGLIDSGLGELVGLTRLPSGRLIGIDRTTRRIHELSPTVLLQSGTVDEPGPKAPRLLGLVVGDGAANGFRSAPLTDTLLGGSLDVIDLAVAPSGRLVALAQRAGASFPSLLRLAPIDRNGNGQFAPDGGLFLGQPGDVLLDLAAPYSDVLFLSETELLGLDRSADRIDRIDLITGEIQLEIAEVAAFGLPLSNFQDELSPVFCLARGEMQLQATTSLLSNAATEAQISLTPRSVLPPDVEISVWQRNQLQSVTGNSTLSASANADATAFGAVRRGVFHTAQAQTALGGFVADVFEEQFVNKQQLAAQLVGPYPEAEWAEPLGSSGQASGFLRAARGITEVAELGDFRPLADTSLFDPLNAYLRRDEDFGETTLTTAFGFFTEVLLDTTAQALPLPGGSTPGVTSPTTVLGGVFRFRDIVIPEGVRITVRGNNPLTLIATGDVRIDGMIDVSGIDGFSDDSFNSGFIPVRGGPGGPGAGRGGDGHPTLFDPNGPGSIDQYVTPETGERGFGPVVAFNGQLTFKEVGGHGGMSTVGYTPPSDAPESFTFVDDSNNTEHNRPPGGGGGSMLLRGQRSRDGSGAYIVNSNSTFFPFPRCTTNNKIRDALYGNEENFWAGVGPSQPLQCVYFDGQFPIPNAVKPGAEPGDLVFKDGDRSNDFFGPGGEMKVLMGGQGGGGGGSRVDSYDHRLWSPDVFGSPSFPGPPFYPSLFFGVYVSPTLYDAKGAGGGGGGGALMIRSFGDIEVGRLGYLDASGGHGGGGEIVQNSSFSGGGGGGSGGAVILQAAGRIALEGDAEHISAGYIDADDDIGAALDVSGGFGRDARTIPSETGSLSDFTFDYTRSDGGSGGFGFIQLQAGANEGIPEIDEGAFAFARQRAVLKLGRWTDDNFLQGEHLGFLPPNNPNSAFNPPDSLRYIDMLHYRYWQLEGTGFFAPSDHYYVLNGSFPPIIPSTDGDNGQGFVNEWPEGSGQLWADTRMMESPDFPGTYLVEEPEPDHVMRTYTGWDPETILEFNNSPFDPDFPFSPGETYKNERLPFGQLVEEPSGKPLFAEVDGKTVFDPENTIPILPVVPLDVAPPVISPITTGTSTWLDFSALAVRDRDLLGRTPPFFEPIHGTYNAGAGLIPAGKDGQLILGSQIQGQPARRVAKAGSFPVDPGLFGQAGDPPFNDIEVDALDLLPFGETDALANNAKLTLLFQGAHSIRSGSPVPDSATLSPWVSDLTQLDGFELVRFRVEFDLEVDPVNFPFDAHSFRPQVERVRLRLKY